MLFDDGAHCATAPPAIASGSASGGDLLGRARPAGDGLGDRGARRPRAETHVHQRFTLVAGWRRTPVILAETNLS